MTSNTGAASITTWEEDTLTVLLSLVRGDTRRLSGTRASGVSWAKAVAIAGGNDTATALAGMGQHVVHKVDPASLAGSAENLGDGSLQAPVRMGKRRASRLSRRGGSACPGTPSDRLGL